MKLSLHGLGGHLDGFSMSNDDLKKDFIDQLARALLSSLSDGNFQKVDDESLEVFRRGNKRNR